MAVKNILLVWKGDDINKENIRLLTTKTLPVNFPLSKEDKNIIQDLKDTANELPCAGISANQIGYDKKIFIGAVDYSKDEYEIVINLEIIEYTKDSIIPGVYRSDEKMSSLIKSKLHLTGAINDEACLSIPGFHMFFPRYDKIKVKYLTENGEEVTKHKEKFDSKLFQHETDHLNGLVIADRAINALKNKDGDIFPYSDNDKYYLGNDEDLSKKNFERLKLLIDELFVSS